MAKSTKIWRAVDLARFGYDELRQLRLPELCVLDALDLDDEGQFAAVRVRWPLESVSRAEVDTSLERWWRGLGRATTVPRSAPATPLRLVALAPRLPGARRLDTATAPNGSLRALVARALHELEADFERAIARKLEQLMGERPVPQQAPRPSKSRVRRRAARVGPTPPKPTGASRSARDGEIRARILAALADGQPRSRGELLHVARLFEDQVPIVIQELRTLRGLGIVEVRGARGSTKYVLTPRNAGAEGAGGRREERGARATHEAPADVRPGTEHCGRRT